MKLPQPILITGAASGLGAACAALFSSLGAKTYLLDKDNMIACDISDEKQVETTLLQLPEIPRVVIHCAGIAFAKKITKMTTAEFKKVIDINLMGTFNVIKACVEKMQSLPVNEQGERGVIITVASIAAFEGQIGQSAYSASKGGVAGMTLPLARELAEIGIRVMSIAPGLIETPMFASIKEEVRDNLAKSVPFPKRLGHPEEFALLAKHIIENPYLNGSVIRLDGACRLP